MKKLILFVCVLTMMLSVLKNNPVHAIVVNKSLVGWEEAFYKHLGQNIKYPKQASMKNHQGNSLITFTIAAGKLKDLKIETELGEGCDVEVLNKIMSFSGFAMAKSGKYAVKTMFRLEGATTTIENEFARTPEGYKELKLTIMGFATKTEDIVSGYGKVGAIKIDRNYSNGSSSIIVRSPANGDANKQPMIVLNDKVMPYGSLKEITPDSIQTITILKDFSAIAKYGEEGRNGVIIITLKDPKTLTPKKEPETINKN